DDVHAADSPSLLLLRFLTAQLAGSRVLICCCYRDIEAGRELAATLVDLGRDPVTHRVALSGLDERATEHLLKETMGSAPPAELLSRVHAATRKMRLHREIAAVLENRYAGSLDRHASELAHHYLLGGSSVAEQAIAFATRAGDHAASQHAHEEAARRYAAALELHESTSAGE